MSPYASTVKRQLLSAYRAAISTSSVCVGLRHLPGVNISDGDGFIATEDSYPGAGLQLRMENLG